MASFEGVHLLFAAASQLHGNKRLARRTMDHRPIGCKDRSVAGAIPGAIGIVPGHGAALMGACRGNAMQGSISIPTDRDLLVASLNDPAFADQDVVRALDDRFAVAIFMKVLGVGPYRVVEPLPGAETTLDRVGNHRPGGSAVADAPSVEAGGNVKARSLLRIRFADIGYSIRPVVVLIAPAPGNRRRAGSFAPTFPGRRIVPRRSHPDRC